MKMEIIVLGPGCHKCHSLEKTVQEVLNEMGLSAEVKKITDFKAIAAHGILLTPGLIVNGKIKAMGKVLHKNEIKNFLQQEM